MPDDKKSIPSIPQRNSPEDAPDRIEVVTVGATGASNAGNKPEADGLSTLGDAASKLYRDASQSGALERFWKRKAAVPNQSSPEPAGMPPAQATVDLDAASDDPRSLQSFAQRTMGKASSSLLGMPFRDAIFWISLTVAGFGYNTGGLSGGIIMAAGIAGLIFSLRHHLPAAAYQTWILIAALLLVVGTSGYDIYDRHFGRPAAPVATPQLACYRGPENAGIVVVVITKFKLGNV